MRNIRRRARIRLLCEQGYEYLSVHDESGLIANLRRQLEVLNSYTFTDSEWKRFFSETLANANEGIVEKTRTIQTDHVKVLRRDDGSSKNIQLIDKKNVHNNHLQVINQYEVSSSEGAAHDNRYDVTILVNGLPLVHVELKRRGVAIREAFNQIRRYQRDSFLAASGGLARRRGGFYDEDAVPFQDKQGHFERERQQRGEPLYARGGAASAFPPDDLFRRRADGHPVHEDGAAERRALDSGLRPREGGEMYSVVTAIIDKVKRGCEFEQLMKRHRKAAESEAGALWTESVVAPSVFCVSLKGLEC